MQVMSVWEQENCGLKKRKFQSVGILQDIRWMAHNRHEKLLQVLDTAKNCEKDTQVWGNVGLLYVPICEL